MKQFKRISSILCLLLLVMSLVFTRTSVVKAAPSTTTITNTGAITSFITVSDDDYGMYTYKLADGTVAYCYSGPGNWPTTGLTYTLDSEASAAIVYIIEHGAGLYTRTYPEVVEAPAAIDQYIIQAAIWWYRAEIKNEIAHLSAEFKETGADNYEIRDIIKNLATEANSHASDTTNKKAYVFKSAGYQDVVALYEETTPDPEPEEVCVEYHIVGTVRPNPDTPIPADYDQCYDKGTEYTQKPELTTKDTNCKFNGWYTTYTNNKLSGKWTNGTALQQKLDLYGAWECGTPVKVPATAANTPLIILGVGLTSIVIGAVVYLHREKKINSNK